MLQQKGQAKVKRFRPFARSDAGIVDVSRGGSGLVERSLSEGPGGRPWRISVDRTDLRTAFCQDGFRSRRAGQACGGRKTGHARELVVNWLIPCGFWRLPYVLLASSIRLYALKTTGTLTFGRIGPGNHRHNPSALPFSDRSGDCPVDSRPAYLLEAKAGSQGDCRIPADCKLGRGCLGWRGNAPAGG